MAYIIMAPDYHTNSAGVRALYFLADSLNKRGYVTFVTGSAIGSNRYCAPLISKKTARTLLQKEDFAVIYTEIVKGNPLNAKRVIRWVANKPGYIGGDKVYDESEMVFVHSYMFAPYVKNKIMGRLYLFRIDEEIFYHDEVHDKIRTESYFYVGKSSYKNGFFDKKITKEITRNEPSRAELGPIFRQAKILYCFDNCTALSTEALMCGCAVMLILDGTQKRKEIEAAELGVDGMVFGLEEIPEGLKNVDTFYKKYPERLKTIDGDIDDFIALTKPSMPPRLWTTYDLLKLFHKGHPASKHVRYYAHLPRESDTILLLCYMGRFFPFILDIMDVLAAQIRALLRFTKNLRLKKKKASAAYTPVHDQLKK